MSEPQERHTMEFDQASIEAAIVREVSERIIGEDELYSRVKNALDARINKHFKDAADAQIRHAIELAIADGFEREYQRVNSFGQREGEPTTIRAELENMIGGYWNTQVNSKGEPSSSSYGSITRAQWMMTQLVASDFQGEMKQHVVNLGGALKDRLRAELHETVNKLLSEVFHVNSVQDQAARGGGHGRSVLDPKKTGSKAIS